MNKGNYFCIADTRFEKLGRLEEHHPYDATLILETSRLIIFKISSMANNYFFSNLASV